MAPGRRSWLGCGPAVMRPKGSNGRSAQTPPWSARTSTPPAPAGPPPLTCPRGALANDKNPGGGKADREGLGRSRGGLSTKIHLAADRRCRPLTRITTPGQHGDCPQFIPLMQAIRIGRRGKGQPRTRPGRAMADKAYSSAANRAYLRRRGIKAVIPRQGRPEKPPSHPRPLRRPPARVRPRPLPRAQHRRARLRQAQAIQGRGNPIRQARAHLPGHRGCRLNQNLATRPAP
jgi:Transposase DDE domain